MEQIVDRGSYIAIDLETTGLDPKTERIIEIGAVCVEDGEIKREFSSLINPCRELSDHIRQLTGIEDDMVADAPEIKDIIGELMDFCRDFPLLGHHIIFDYSFLKRAAVNCGYQFEKEGIDTLALCRTFMPENERKNLACACRFFRVEAGKNHRALSDARAAHFLYQSIRDVHFTSAPELFSAKPLIYRVKREQPASKKQKEVLRDLIKYHKISLTVQIDSLTRNEVSRITDKVISQYGRIAKR